MQEFLQTLELQGGRSLFLNPHSSYIIILKCQLILSYVWEGQQYRNGSDFSLKKSGDVLLYCSLRALF